MVDSCEGCGGSCCYTEVLVTLEDARRISRYVGHPDWRSRPSTPTRRMFPGSVGTMHRDEQGACIFLSGEGYCSIYEVRPEMCAEFEVGCAMCLKIREIRGLSDPNLG